METKTYKLDSLCEITSSKRIFYSEYTESGIPFFRSKEIIDLFNKNNIATELFISENRYNEIKNKFGVPEEDDMLLTSVGSIGIPYLVKSSDKFYFKDGNLTWFRKYNRKLIDPLYLYQWVISSVGKETLTRLSMGAAQPALTISRLKKLSINIPSISVQQKIASILSAYDRLIENNTRRIRLLEQMAENLYKEWFVRFRFPGHEKVEMVNGLPKGWKINSLKEICEFKRGRNITSAEMCDGIIQVISAGVAPSGYHNKANVHGVSVTMSSSGANAGYISIHYDDIWAADCSYISEKETEDIYYVYELLNNIRQVINNFQIGAAQPHVYPKDINRIKTCVPPKELRIKANTNLSKIHKEIHKLYKQNQLLTRQRDLLLPRLMSGKLEVKS